ncbi:MAG: D-alanyl-D-alanine carboxypeptidase/D-alanyl-D-alanine-endopeptidase [Deltaproteobacteria bacterium]|nr:D-alanyl-D-alanine carboxypeptidase/D-alanyl-D-alanine-endopeptidase [Deltaproteobacteria bacterium]
MAVYFSALLALLVGAACASVSPLARVVAAAETEGATVSALAVDADDGRIYYRHREDARTLPASTLKLVTTWLALETLGADFRFTTRVQIGPGAAVQGTLAADVCVEPSGDPTFASDRFAETRDAVSVIAERLIEPGMRTWSGALSYCTAASEPMLGPGWAWDDAGAYYSATPGRFVVAENVIALRVVSNGVTPIADAAASARLERLGLSLVLRTDADSDDLTCRLAPGASVVDCAVPPRAGRFDAKIAVPEPLRLFALMLADALDARGVLWTGTLAPPPAEPGPHRLLAEVQSPQLADITRATNQASVNVFAERLALTVAARLGGEPTYAAWQRVVRTWMDAHLVPKRAYTVVDGSGLSRHNALSARALVQVLQAALAHPAAPAFFSGLSIAGTNGTLRRRGRGGDADGRVFAKSGTLAHQRGLAGIAYREGKGAIVFTVLVGHHPGDLAELNRVTDAILNAIGAP